jgi:hypothetical protein
MLLERVTSRGPARGYSRYNAHRRFRGLQISWRHFVVILRLRGTPSLCKLRQESFAHPPLSSTSVFFAVIDPNKSRSPRDPFGTIRTTALRRRARVSFRSRETRGWPPRLRDAPGRHRVRRGVPVLRGRRAGRPVSETLCRRARPGGRGGSVVARRPCLVRRRK